MLAALPLLASLTSLALVPQPPCKTQRQTAAPLGGTATNTRRGALLAGSTAAISMLPATAFADSIADIAARNNAQALDERLNGESYNKEKEDQQILVLCGIAAIVFLGPVTGIKGAQEAIRKMSASGDLDPDMRESLRSNDPPIFGKKKAPYKAPEKPQRKLPWQR